MNGVSAPMQQHGGDQPLKRLFLSGRPPIGVVGWLAGFLFLFFIFGTGRGAAPAGGGAPPPAGAAPSGAAAPASTEPKRDTVRIGLWLPPRGVFNPLFTDDAGDRQVNDLLFESLLSHGPDLRPEPNLAESFSVREDQQAITFTLRPDALWHDGTPLTSEDVIFTLETVLHKDYRGPYAGKFLYILGARNFRDGKAPSVTGLVAEGPRTVTIHLAKPYGPALEEIGSLLILPRHAFDGIAVADMAMSRPSREPVGSGPFRWESALVAGAGRSGGDGLLPAGGAYEVVLTPFPDFFGGRPKLGSVRFLVIGPQLDLTRLTAEEIDLVSVSRSDAEAVKRAGGYTIREWPEPGYHYMGINMGRAALVDRRVRQALAFALDRGAMLQEVYGGHGTLVHAPVFPGSWAEAPGMNTYAYNPEEAGRLLDAAGWRDGDGDGVRERGGKTLTLSLYYRRGQPVDELLAALTREYLGRIGVRVNAKGVTTSELLRNVFGLRDFDLYLLGWQITADPEPGVSKVFGPGARVNAVGFREKESLDLLSKAASLVDIEQRQPLYEQWTRNANEELPYVFLFTPNNLIAISNRLRDVRVTALGYTDGAERWWLGP